MQSIVHFRLFTLAVDLTENSRRSVYRIAFSSLFLRRFRKNAKRRSENATLPSLVREKRSAIFVLSCVLLCLSLSFCWNRRDPTQVSGPMMKDEGPLRSFCHRGCNNNPSDADFETKNRERKERGKNEEE